MAAFSVTQYLLTVGIMVFIGLGNGTQFSVSYNHGAGLTERVKGTLLRLLTVSVFIGVIFFVVMRFQTAAPAGFFIPVGIVASVLSNFQVPLTPLPKIFQVPGTLYPILEKNRICR